MSARSVLIESIVHAVVIDEDDQEADGTSQECPPLPDSTSSHTDVAPPLPSSTAELNEPVASVPLPPLPVPPATSASFAPTTASSHHGFGRSCFLAFL